MGAKVGLTIKAKAEIEKADLIFGATRMLETIKEGTGKKYPYYLEKDIMPVILEEASSKSIKASILFSGDTGFYSGADKLYKALKDYDNLDVEIIPGASSLSYFSAKLGVSYQDAKIVSTHGVTEDKWTKELLEAIETHNKIFFITSGAKDVATIGTLLEKDYPDLKVMLGFNLSYPDEKIMEATFEQCKAIKEKGLYAGMLIKDKASSRILTPGIPDEEFIRDKVPMTKEEVRILSICKLGLKSDSVVFDVGSGTGSIAIEIAKLSNKIKVYAIETNSLALNLIEQNKEKFKASNIEIIEALAPEKFDLLPIPTHAFIGGSKGNLKEILIALREKNPSMRVVINAVSMETIVEVQTIFKEIDIKNPEICMVNVSKAKKLGEYNLMQAANPVYIYSFNF